MSAPFAATKFNREYAVCDHDSGRFETPYPQVAEYADELSIVVMRDALQKAWIVLDALRSYRPDSELLDLINSEQLADAREAVRLAGSLQISKGL